MVFQQSVSKKSWFYFQFWIWNSLWLTWVTIQLVERLLNVFFHSNISLPTHKKVKCCGGSKESIQVGKLRHGFIPLVHYSQSQHSISSNNQSYEANVVFVGDKVGTLSTCILSLIIGYMCANLNFNCCCWLPRNQLLTHYAHAHNEGMPVCVK